MLDRGRDAVVERDRGDLLGLAAQHGVGERRPAIAPLRDEAQLRAESVRRDLAVERIGSDAVVAEDENVTARHDGGH